MGSTDTTRDFYNTVADTYAEWLPDTRHESPLELGIVDHFIAQLTDSDLPVLDAGCGTGRMLDYLAARGVSPLAGVDLSPAMLAHARRAQPQVPLEVASLDSLPFADGSLRAILCWYAIIHSTADEAAAIVKETHRVLAPGGSILLGFQAGTGGRTVHNAYGNDVTLHGVLHEARDIAAMLTEVGFEVTLVADRGPVGVERSHQGFVSARRSG